MEQKCKFYTLHSFPTNEAMSVVGLKRHLAQFLPNHPRFSQEMHACVKIILKTRRRFSLCSLVCFICIFTPSFPNTSPASEIITIRFAGWISGREDREFATAYGYPKIDFKREPDTDQYIRNAFIDISRIQTFGKSCTLHNH